MYASTTAPTANVPRNQSISTIQPISEFRNFATLAQSNIAGSNTPVISQTNSNSIASIGVTGGSPYPIIVSPQTSPQSEPESESQSQTQSSQLSQTLTPIMDISPAIAVSDSELACFHAVRYVLRTHKNLTDDDVQYAANYISSLYSHSLDILADNPEADNVLTDDQLAMFLVYADQTGIARFALIFNEELDTAIKAKDNAALKKIVLGPKEMFVELYDNTFLSTEDRDFITRLIARESFAAILLLELLKKKIINLETIEDSCISETLSVEAKRDGKEVRLSALTTKCYDEVCIHDAKILEDDEGRAAMSKHEKPPETVFTIDKPSSSQTPQVYCFNTIDLIAAVINDVPINPKTGEPFSDYSLSLIQRRFHKEIAMYKRYNQIKSLRS